MISVKVKIMKPFSFSQISVEKEKNIQFYSYLSLCTCLHIHNFLSQIISFFFNPLQDGHFRGCSRMGGPKSSPPLPKICHRYPTMMKLATVIPYLKKIRKIYDHMTHTLSSADISIFALEISKFCYIKKYKYRLHFDTSFLILLTFL